MRSLVCASLLLALAVVAHACVPGILPSKPGNFLANPIGSGGLSLNWDGPGKTEGCADGYQVAVTEKATGRAAQPVVVQDTNIDIKSGLQAGATYQVAVTPRPEPTVKYTQEQVRTITVTKEVRIPEIREVKVAVPTPVYVDKPVIVEKPVERIVEKPVVVEKIVEKIVDRPVEVIKTVDVPVPVPVPVVQIKEVVRTVDRPVAVPVPVPVPNPVPVNVYKPVYVPVPNPVPTVTGCKQIENPGLVSNIGYATAGKGGLDLDWSAPADKSCISQYQVVVTQPTPPSPPPTFVPQVVQRYVVQPSPTASGLLNFRQPVGGAKFGFNIAPFGFSRALGAIASTGNLACG